MKKLLTFTILATILANCSSGIEEYTCDRGIFLTLDTKNNTWEEFMEKDDWTGQPKSDNGKISQINDNYLAMSKLYYNGEEGIAYFFNRKEKRILANPNDYGVDIAYATSFDNEDNLIANCK